MITDAHLLRAFFATTSSAAYERRVRVYERQGMTRSDAQGLVEMEMMQEFLKDPTVDKLIVPC